ncbi:MAG TPA: tetratricopeptide repeat protein [Terriglobales bacterium]|nr:tetratricopeptide repeat protein [Terriglobales bacterium]
MSGRIDRIRTIELAERFVKTGKIKEAIAEYERLVGTDPQDVGTLNIIGDLYMRLNTPDRAVRSFLKVAEEYEKRGLYSQALAIYKKVYKIQPQDADISLKLADLYSQQGFQSDAKDEYLKTAARFLQEKKFQEAIHVYEKVCKLDREDLGLKKELADLYRQQGYIDAALEQLGEIAAIRTAQGSFEEAEALLKEALSLNPTDSGTIVSLVELYRRWGKPEMAIELVEASLRDQPENLALTNLLGNFYFAAGDVDKAEAIFTDIVNGHPTNVNARVKLGRIRILKDRLDQAYELFEPLITNLIKKHKDEKAIGLLGLILESERPHPPALERLASIYRTNKEAKKLEVVLRALLDELRKQGEKEKTLAVLTELRQIRGDDAEFAREYRALRKEMGLPDETGEEEVSEVTGKDREAIQETLAQADLYMQQGLVRIARRLLENLTLRYPDEPQIMKKIAVLDEVRTHIDEEELRRRVEKASALEANKKKEKVQREERIEERRPTLGPFAEEALDGDKVSTADIFAETDIIPFMSGQDGERRFYDLSKQAKEELRMLKAAYARQVQGEMTQDERDLSNIVADFKKDLRAKVSSDNNEIHYHLGIAFMEQGLYTEAIEEFSQASKDKALALECFSLISYCHRQRRNFPDGEKWLKKALVLAREGSDQYYALEFDLAELYEQASDKDRALSLYKDVLSWNPGYRNISGKITSLEGGASA